MKKLLLLICFTILGVFLLNICTTPASSSAYAEGVTSGIGSIYTNNYANRTLEYYYYFPSNLKYKTAPFLIMVPGLSGKGQDFVFQEFKNFAQSQGFVIIAPSFQEDDANWDNQTSYQYPAAWSGNALNAILNNFMSAHYISSNGIYLYGFSAGAQFAERYSLLHPNSVNACAIHAPGGVTMPGSYQKTKFFISVGAQDEDYRKQTASDFYSKAKSLGIRAQYKQYNCSHMVPGEQIRDSIEFFKQSR